MKRQLAVWAIITVAVLLALRPARADFPHQKFNASEVAQVRLCQPDFATDAKTHEQEAVKTERVVTDAKAVALFHKQAQTERCADPHVRPKGEKLCVLAYLDKAGQPLALVQLWPNGDYFIYEGFADDSGKLLKGHAAGDHGGCSCGKNTDLAESAKAVLNR